MLALLLTGCGTRKHLPATPAPTEERESIAPVGLVGPAWVAPTGDSIHQEMRAVWLTTVYGLDWPRDKADTPEALRRQKAHLEQILDRLQADGYNTVFLQLRHSGTTIYPDGYEPQSSRFTTEDGSDYDPVIFALEACHKRGLAMHAWLVTYPLVSSRNNPHPLTEDHPEWVFRHRGGHHLDPGQPGVRSYIAHLATEVARRYPVDGIHFDYFRYPEGAASFPDGATYARYGKDYPDKATWRRANLTAQLREVRDSLAAAGVRVPISVAPLGKLRVIPTLGRSHGWTAYETVYQDPETWAKEGLVDFLVPMMYYRGQLYEPFLKDWKRLVAPYTPVVPGLAPYQVEESKWPTAVIKEQIELERQEGLSGICFFRDAFVSDRYPALRQIAREAFATTALPLSLKQGTYTALPRPEWQDHTLADGRLTLNWRLSDGRPLPRGSYYRLWLITEDKDGHERASLLAPRIEGTSCTLRVADLSPAHVYTFGLEAVNVFGVATTNQTSYRLGAERLR